MIKKEHAIEALKFAGNDLEMWAVSTIEKLEKHIRELEAEREELKEENQQLKLELLTAHEQAQENLAEVERLRCLWDGKAHFDEDTAMKLIEDAERWRKACELGYIREHYIREIDTAKKQDDEKKL